MVLLGEVDMFFCGGDGIADDAFCHLVDAWVAGEMERKVRDEINRAVDSLDPFRAAKGDRFADANALAKAIEEWTVTPGGRQRHRTAHRVLDELLTMWRSLDEAVEEDE